MGDELNTGVEQAVIGTPLETEAVQAAEQTVEATPASDKSLPTAGVDKETEFHKLQGEYTRATQELSAYRKVGKTPDEIAAAIRSYEQNQQIAEALQNLANGNKPPEDELPPDLRNNPILTDPDYGYVKQALEYVAEQQIKPLSEAQAQRDQTAIIRAAQSACGEFAKANPELNLTAQQLYDTCITGKHNPFTQLTQAAIDAVGGFQKFSDLHFKKRLEDYQRQAQENRKKSGTVVSATAPVGTGMEQPENWEDHFNLMAEHAQANARHRENMGG